MPVDLLFVSICLHQEKIWSIHLQRQTMNFNSVHWDLRCSIDQGKIQKVSMVIILNPWLNLVLQQFGYSRLFCLDAFRSVWSKFSNLVSGWGFPNSSCPMPQIWGIPYFYGKFSPAHETFKRLQRQDPRISLGLRLWQRHRFKWIA